MLYINAPYPPPPAAASCPVTHVTRCARPTLILVPLLPTGRGFLGHFFVLAVWRQISKFSLLSGERTTTVGYPTNLGEGNRDLRAMLRSLSNPKILVRALARGQGLTDLRDAEGVLMSAPSLKVGGWVGVSFTDVTRWLLRYFLPVHACG